MSIFFVDAVNISPITPNIASVTLEVTHSAALNSAVAGPTAALSAAIDAASAAGAGNVEKKNCDSLFSPLLINFTSPFCTALPICPINC